MRNVRQALFVVAMAVAIAGGSARASIGMSVEIVNKTASAVSVSVELNTGHRLGRIDLGPGATGRVNVAVPLETVRARGRNCNASMQTSSRSARSFKVTVVPNGATRCEVNIYPVA